MASEHTIKLAQAALEVGDWMAGESPTAQLELLGHDPKQYSQIADTIGHSFAGGLMHTGDLSYLRPHQKAMVLALAATCWEMGAIAAEVAYGSRSESTP